MVLFAVIASHANVDLNTVARLSAGADSLPTDTVVLATCNRLEIYGTAPSANTAQAQRAAITDILATAAGVGTDVVENSMTFLTGSSVSKHLFAVAAGLDSAVVGEREVAGQVRRALSSAQAAHPVPGPLVKLFQTASRTAKAVGSQTALGSQGRSVVSVALDLCADLSSATWAERKVSVFGTGAYAGVTMALLREHGVTDVSVYSSSGRADDFVATRGGTAVHTLSEALGSADLVIGCSGSDSQVGAADLAQIRYLSGSPLASEAPLTIVDLALSHDFDPELANVPGVDLLTLESVRMAAPDEQESATAAAARIVSQAANEFETEQSSRSLDSAIVALRKHTMGVLESELERVRAQHGCTAAAQEVEFALRRMVKQLLHIPTVRAKQLAAEGRQEDYLAALDALYGIQLMVPETVSAGFAATHDAVPSAGASCPADSARLA